MPKTQPKTWSWIISPDKNGRPIDKESADALLEAFGSTFRFYLIREGNMPRHVKIIKPYNPGMEGTRILFLRNKLEVPEHILNQMSAFLNGFLCHRTFQPQTK